MLILLIGPKGSGKSHIGRILEARLGVHFFHVEPLWMAYHAGRADAGKPVDIAEGVATVHPRIAEDLTQHEHVCVETTGASREILDDLLHFGEEYGLLTAKVAVPLDVCLKRIRRRNPTHQIPMEEDMIHRVYELAESLEMPFDLVIENLDLSDDEIVKRFGSVLPDLPDEDPSES